MAIYAPGRRDPRGKNKVSKRNVVAGLTLTAMVDMFTVLTIFLLQNYNVTGQVLDIPKGVTLPKATAVKELKPAHIVTITPKDVILDKETVASFVQVREQKDWRIQGLYNRLVQVLKQEEMNRKKGAVAALKSAVRGQPKGQKLEEENPRRLTVQADKDVDFLTIKKVMYTVTEAGALEINFAVIKKDTSEGAAAPN